MEENKNLTPETEENVDAVENKTAEKAPKRIKKSSRKRQKSLNIKRFYAREAFLLP